MWTLSLPLAVSVGKDKSVRLNLNVYRNLHHYLNNNAKVAFKELILPKLSGIPRQDKIHLNYVLFTPNAAKRDIMNIGCIVDKFFSDLLTEAKVIDDDHGDIVVSASFSFGGIDRANPRVDVTIYPVTQPMTVIYNPEGTSFQ